EACKLLGLSGRVLPMSPEPLYIEADVTGIDEPGDPHAVSVIRGQVAVAATPGRVRQIRLHNADGKPPRACEAAVQAVLDADLVLLGPGSWFTSVLVHLLVPDLHEALIRTNARKVIVMNLVPQPGETAGFSPEQHRDVLRQHAPQLTVDAVIADGKSVPAPSRLRAVAKGLGARAVLGDVADGNGRRHAPDALAATVGEALGVEREEVGWATTRRGAPGRRGGGAISGGDDRSGEGRRWRVG